ncbi:unnamed protein product, partial [Adineta steineri]
MKIRTFFHWLYKQIYDYNLFIPDEDEYDEINDNIIDPATAVRHQRYATRLYIPLLIITLYILFFVTLINPQTRTNTISNITPTLFNQLHLEHSETLSCPCSTITIPYKNFVSKTISFHPVCSSIFVSKQWIEALYLPYAGTLLVMDFRTTASYQFKLLADLCILSQKTITQSLSDLNNTQLITGQLLSEEEIEFKIIC